MKYQFHSKAFPTLNQWQPREEPMIFATALGHVGKK